MASPLLFILIISLSAVFCVPSEYYRLLKIGDGENEAFRIIRSSPISADKFMNGPSIYNEEAKAVYKPAYNETG